MNAPVVVDGMQGMGDNIYQTPVVEYLLAKNDRVVYLKTPWPQLYKPHRNLRFLPVNTRLRTQGKNEKRSIGLYSPFPSGIVTTLRLCYVKWQRMGVAMYKGLSTCVGLNSAKYRLAFYPKKKERSNFAIIRPATVRKEWAAPARNPKQEYIQRSIDILNSAGLETIVVADIDEPAETYAEFRPLRASQYYEKGELPVERLIEMVATARIVVGGVGFLAPMGLAVGADVVLLHGGAGAFNGPKIIDAPGLGKLHHLLPVHHCMCANNSHTSCNKKISVPLLERTLAAILETNPVYEKAG